MRGWTFSSIGGWLRNVCGWRVVVQKEPLWREQWAKSEASDGGFALEKVFCESGLDHSVYEETQLRRPDERCFPNRNWEADESGGFFTKSSNTTVSCPCLISNAIKILALKKTPLSVVPPGRTSSLHPHKDVCQYVDSEQNPSSCVLPGWAGTWRCDTTGALYHDWNNDGLVDVLDMWGLHGLLDFEIAKYPVIPLTQ